MSGNDPTAEPQPPSDPPGSDPIEPTKPSSEAPRTPESPGDADRPRPALTPPPTPREDRERRPPQEGEVVSSGEAAGEDVEPPDPRFLFSAGGCLYLLLGPVALLWLSARDRGELLKDRAVGDYGLVADAGIGLTLAAITLGVWIWLSRDGRPLAALEAKVRRLRGLGGIGEGYLLWFAITTALGEELLFRLAAQDALGLFLAVGAFAVLQFAPGYLAWTAFAAVFGLVLGGCMASGLGLLSVCIAHATFVFMLLLRLTNISPISTPLRTRPPHPQ